MSYKFKCDSVIFKLKSYDLRHEYFHSGYLTNPKDYNT